MEQALTLHESQAFAIYMAAKTIAEREVRKSTDEDTQADVTTGSPSIVQMLNFHHDSYYSIHHICTGR
jgi:hypothetical protein